MTSSLKELYRAEQLPIFQNRMFDSSNEAQESNKGDIVLVQDLQTGLISNQAFRPELLEYDANYQNEQATSSMFRSHLDDVSKIVNQHFARHTLIEVGCGKGFFLEHLQNAGCDIKGLDPTYEGDNPSIIKEYFTPELALHADALILRHVLEHIQNPVGFLNSIKESNGGKGKIYIEVPCFDWICEHRSWFDVFYEHVNYFRLDDFDRMFGTVFESGHIFGGQYLYAVADLETLKKPVWSKPDALPFPSDFLSTVEAYAERLKAQKEERCSVVWGGASKGVIFSLFMERAGAKVDFVVDINPAKQGRYLPATGLRVHSPEEMLAQHDKPIDIFVMNSNYLDEIKELTGHKFNYYTVENGAM